MTSEHSVSSSIDSRIRSYLSASLRAGRETARIVFDLLNQKQRAKPSRLSWAMLLNRTFGKNPLIRRDGSVLRRVGRLEPFTAV